MFDNTVADRSLALRSFADQTRLHCMPGNLSHRHIGPKQSRLFIGVESLWDLWVLCKRGRSGERLDMRCVDIVDIEAYHG